MELSKEFSLKWNNFLNNLTSGFFCHLNEKDLVDVTLAVEGQLITAHKLVLSICSPYFKNIFKENPCQHPVIILQDIKQTEVEALLKFMYQGEVNVKQEDLPTFLKVAQTLQIKGLEGGEGKIIPLLSDYVNMSDAQSDSECATALSDTTIEQESKEKNLNEFLSYHRLNKRKAKKRKKHVAEDDHSSIEKFKSELNIKSDDKICLLSDDEKDINNSESEDVRCNSNNSSGINDNEEIIELNNETNSLQSVEPVIYRLSARGRPQLVYEGYVYNLTSGSKVLNRLHYRCAEQHRGCRGKCSVIAERFMPTGIHSHNHPPGYQSEYDYRKKKGLDTESI